MFFVCLKVWNVSFQITPLFQDSKLLLLALCWQHCSPCLQLGCCNRQPRMWGSPPCDYLWKRLADIQSPSKIFPLPRFWSRNKGVLFACRIQASLCLGSSNERGRHWTKDGEGCCPVAMTTTGMYRLDRGWKKQKKTLRLCKEEKHEMGFNKWSCTIHP